jgi:hypothetical protein
VAALPPLLLLPWRLRRLLLPLLPPPPLQQRLLLLPWRRLWKVLVHLGMLLLLLLTLRC